MAEPSVTKKSLRDSLSIPELLKSVGQFVGVVGGGGAGFTALAFGVGYLAIKNHDAMLGLPTTISSYESYVRTGALFFPNSVQYLISGLSAYGGVAITVLILAIVISLMLLMGQSRFKSNDEGTVKVALKIAGLLVAYSVIIIIAFSSSQRQIAVLHPVNKDLLLTDPADVDSTQYTTTQIQIHDWLREEDLDGIIKLQHLYGIQLFETIFLIFGAFLLGNWRRKMDDPGDFSWSLAVTDWLFRPVLYGLLGALLLVLPSNYGVLCLPNRLPCVEVTLKDSGDEPEDTAFLISDLSTETTEIVAISISDGGFLHHVYTRSEVEKIDLIGCEPKSILGVR